MKLAGRYRLLNALGEGSVRLAFDEAEHRDVAVKELHYPASLPELLAAAEVRHPSIVPVFDVPVEEGVTWLVMEFVSGSSLERSVLARHPLPVVQVARIGVHLLDALTAAHAAGIVHGRVNPGNVMLTVEGQAILTGLCGPRPALPPSSDLWSMAATLHFALEGRPPGEAPAPGDDPLRALLRELLSLSGPPPVETVSAVLHDVAANRATPLTPASRGRHALAPPPPSTPTEPNPEVVAPPSLEPRPALQAPPVPEPRPALQAPPIPEPRPALLPPPSSGPGPGAQRSPDLDEEPAPSPDQDPDAQRVVERPALLVSAGAGLRRALRRRKVQEPPPPALPAPTTERTLDQVIAATGPLAPARVATIGLAVLDQLADLHARDEHHGDVRPGTILFDDERLMPPVMPSGISAYTAPEGNTGPAADLWSLGATLYAAVEGTPPSPGAPLSRSGALAPVLFQLLAGDPAHRPTLDALRRDLTAVAR